MAEGSAREFCGNRAEIFSAGSRPSGFVHPTAIQSMQEIGINISKHYSKSTSQVPQEQYDAVVTMGCGNACPHLAAKLRRDWQIPDPVAGNQDYFISVREMIRAHVNQLLKDMNLSVSKESSPHKSAQ